VAVTVGAVVTVAAASSGAGGCGAGVDTSLSITPVDDVCYHLVRSMAERAGLLMAVMTAVVALTVIGVYRVMAAWAEPDGERDRP
jgi:hypothetical protein